MSAQRLYRLTGFKRLVKMRSLWPLSQFIHQISLAVLSSLLARIEDRESIILKRKLELSYSPNRRSSSRLCWMLCLTQSIWSHSVKSFSKWILRVMANSKLISHSQHNKAQQTSRQKPKKLNSTQLMLVPLLCKRTLLCSNPRYRNLSWSRKFRWTTHSSKLQLLTQNLKMEMKPSKFRLIQMSTTRYKV